MWPLLIFCSPYLQGIEIVRGSLAQIATTYAAHLWILIHNFPVASYRLIGEIEEPCMIRHLEIRNIIFTIEKFVIIVAVMYRLLVAVYPGEPASVALMECDRLDNCLRPGQTIEKFVIQVLLRSYASWLRLSAPNFLFILSLFLLENYS